MMMVVAIFPLGVLISTGLIRLFPNPDGSHFFHNAVGSLLALFIIIVVLKKKKQHPYMDEVAYVWDLKQELNRIYRKSRKLKLGIDDGNREAMIVMNYSHAGSKLLYELDDNTLTMSELNKTADELRETIEKCGYEVSVEDYHSDLLKHF